MPAFDKKKYWKAERFKYKATYLKWRWEKSNEGITFQQFIFRNGLQEEMISYFINTLKAHGYNNVDNIVKQWHKKTGIFVKDAESLLKGDTKTLQVWELEHFMKTFNFELTFQYKGARLFKASVEKGRLIIISQQNPYFVINLNIDDYYDLTIDFSKKEKHITIGEKNVVKFTFEAFRYYFLQEAKLDKLPFNQTKMREIIKQKFFRGEMYIKG